MELLDRQLSSVDRANQNMIFDKPYTRRNSLEPLIVVPILLNSSPYCLQIEITQRKYHFIKTKNSEAFVELLLFV